MAPLQKRTKKQLETVTNMTKGNIKRTHSTQQANNTKHNNQGSIIKI